MYMYAHQAQQLRSKNQTTMVSALVAIVFAFFQMQFLPSVIFSIFFRNTQLLQTPPWIANLSLGIFVVATLYVIYAIVMTVLREKRASYLDEEFMMAEELAMMCCGDDCCGCGCVGEMNHPDETMHMVATEAVAVAKVAEEKATQKTAKKKTAKKTKKSTAKKKSSSKKSSKK